MSSNIQNSNSSSKTKTFFTEKMNTQYKMYTPSPNDVIKERLSDRFIPMNKGLNLLEKFEMTQKWETANNNNKRKNADDNNTIISNANSTTTNDNSNTHSNIYSSLLENNFFGENDTRHGSKIIYIKYKVNAQNNSGIKSKIFSFKQEQKRKSDAYTPKNNWNTLFENKTEHMNNTRKINNRAYKVLDAPGLLDDFYLNLIDWSSKNDIAVGSNNSLYLWCTNKTQVVKLLNYEGEKYISSVIWNSTGTELALGNSEGMVEIWDGKIFNLI
jgi:hypothetical protein